MASPLCNARRSALPPGAWLERGLLLLPTTLRERGNVPLPQKAGNRRLLIAVLLLLLLLPGCLAPDEQEETKMSEPSDLPPPPPPESLPPARKVDVTDIAFPFREEVRSAIRDRYGGVGPRLVAFLANAVSC